MKDNMTVIATLARRAAEQNMSYGRYVAQCDPEKLAAEVRSIRNACLRRRGSRLYRLRKDEAAR